MQKFNSRISIVESSSVWRNQIIESLQQMEGVELVSAYDCAEDAMRKIVKDQPDIVVMTINLPKTNGINCMRRILQKAPNIAFLMFTVHENSRFVFAALKGGALGYILKKEGSRGLIEGIKELQAGGSPMSRIIARKVLRSFQPTDELIQRTSTREREILNLLAKGLLYKEIAANLKPQISEGTVKQHIHRIYKKLEVNNRTEAINKYLGY